MKFKSIITITIFILLIFVSCPCAYGIDCSQEYVFDLTSNGAYCQTVKKGDVITINLHLIKPGSESFNMYGMQTEIQYDSNLLKLIKNNCMTAQGVQTRDIALHNGIRALYINYVSLYGGEQWAGDTMVATFQLEVIGNHGKTMVNNTNYFVSTQDGLDEYYSTSKNVEIKISNMINLVDYFPWWWLLIIAVVIIVLIYIWKKKSQKKNSIEEQKPASL